jgi:hypothetical protein
MSPSEDQLRAALRDGEGGSLDVDTVIQRARAHGAARREHRVRLASAAAIAAVVAGVGVTAGIVLSSGNHTRSSNAAGSANLPKADSTQAYAAGQGQASGALACPTTLPALATPRSGTGRLFASPPTTMQVCAYPETIPANASNSRPVLQSTSFDRSDATTIANSLEGASTAPSLGPCPLFKTSNGRVLVFIATSADETMGPVEATVLQNPCNLSVTNGKAVRYNWTPPPVLSSFLNELQQATAAAPSPSPS